MFATDKARSSQMKIRKKKNVKKGVLFSLMVCGASGTGIPHPTPDMLYHHSHIDV
jgi:septin family protein